MNDRLPTLTIRYPECSHCGEEVEIEDGAASCPRCLIQWSTIDDGAVAEPNPNLDGTEVACEIESRVNQRSAYDYNGKHWQPGPRRPCILPSGHEGAHIHPHSMTVTLLGEAPR